MRDIDLSIVHFLSGPIGVEGAEPGDLLVVDLLDIGAKPESQWGFNGFFSKKNGGGFLTSTSAGPEVDLGLRGHVQKSRHVPGVRFPGLIHPGLIGCLPDPKMLETWNTREKALYDTDPERVPALATLPFGRPPHMGRLKGDAKDAARPPPAPAPSRPRARRQLRHQGPVARLEDLLPGLRPRRGLSMGDLHFSQGDGEITFCGAIEMAGWVHLKVELIKDGMAKYGIKNPIFKPSPITPKYDDPLIFEGISVDESGGQHYLDVHIATGRPAERDRVSEEVRLLGRAGLLDPRHAPVQGHISGVVDIPNACATLWIRPRSSSSTSHRAPTDRPSSSTARSDAALAAIFDGSFGTSPERTRPAPLPHGEEGTRWPDRFLNRQPS